MVNYQGFEVGDDGKIKKTEEFDANARICIKCGKTLEESNIARSEEREITAGAGAGRKALDIWCANCWQRNIFVMPIEH